MGTVACCCCGGPSSMKSKAGEVRLAIASKAGGNLAITLPICQACANKAAMGPDAAIALLRQAAPRLVAE